MEEKRQFPRTMVGGVSCSRMIIGTNWMLGWSHTSAAADKLIRKTCATKEDMFSLLDVYMSYGVDTIMAPFDGQPVLMEAIKAVEEKYQHKMILVDTPRINVSNTKEAYAESAAIIKRSKELGATFCYPHHSSVEELVNKNLQQIPRLPDYLSMVRENGMVPGLSAHMPELIIYSDQNEYDVQSYVQIYNCMGFLMQVEIEYINSVIWNAKKPVMSIKAMAAGRCSPYVGLNFSWATLRDCDMITVGCMTPPEAQECIEISFASFDRRKANLEGRGSPNKTVIMK